MLGGEVSQSRILTLRLSISVCDHPQRLGDAHVLPWVGQHHADRRSRRHHVLRLEHDLFFRLHLPLQSRDGARDRSICRGLCDALGKSTLLYAHRLTY